MIHDLVTDKFRQQWISKLELCKDIWKQIFAYVGIWTTCEQTSRSRRLRWAIISTSVEAARVLFPLACTGRASNLWWPICIDSAFRKSCRALLATRARCAGRFSGDVGDTGTLELTVITLTNGFVYIYILNIGNIIPCPEDNLPDGPIHQRDRFNIYNGGSDDTEGHFPSHFGVGYDVRVLVRRHLVCCFDRWLVSVLAIIRWRFVYQDFLIVDQRGSLLNAFVNTVCPSDVCYATRPTNV